MSNNQGQAPAALGGATTPTGTAWPWTITERLTPYLPLSTGMGQRPDPRKEP